MREILYFSPTVPFTNIIFMKGHDFFISNGNLSYLHCYA